MDDLLQHWARKARHLKLTPLNIHEAKSEDVREFAALVLEELAACGLVEGAEEVGCWATPRPPGN